jgi:dihydrofolate synthase/folylpolyglutamate synthase
MNYNEAQQYLSSLINYEKKSGYDYRRSFKVERMRTLAALLGDPQKDIKSVHIAGTKGKGSTASFIHSILTEAGFRTGLYTSPHLASFCERIRTGSDLITEQEFGLFLERIRAAILKMENDKPSFFEAFTALSFCYFREKKVDFAVYETGLGGRLDATNIIIPMVSCITPISYDHMDILGPTLSQIAREKAGIIKKGVPCVSAPQEPEALSVIEGTCRENNSRLVLAGRDLSYREISGSVEGEVFEVSGITKRYSRLSTELLGEHQVANAATAVGVAEILTLGGVKISTEAVKRGIEKSRWPGRLEIISKEPLVVVDGAHNAASARALAVAVKKIFKYNKLALVLGISSDKDIPGVLAELVPISDTVILTKAAIKERAAEPQEIKKYIKGKKPVITESVEEALEKARYIAGKGDMILVTGSLFVVGQARILNVQNVS